MGSEPCDLHRQNYNLYSSQQLREELHGNDMFTLEGDGALLVCEQWASHGLNTSMNAGLVSKCLAICAQKKPRELHLVIMRAFHALSLSLASGKQMDAQVCTNHIDLLQQGAEKLHMGPEFLADLLAMGKLSPVEDLNWYEGRGAAECERRTGVPWRNLLHRWRETDTGDVMLDIGHGIGRTLEDFREEFHNSYVFLGLADKLHYHLHDFFDRIIDWNALEKLHPLSAQEHRQVCEYLQSLLLLSRDTLTALSTAADLNGEHDGIIEYDKRSIERIKRNPHTIMNLLFSKLSWALRTKKFVMPDTHGKADGNGGVVYPDHIVVSSPEVIKALETLQQSMESQPSTYFKTLRVYSQDATLLHLPTHPVGTVIGDFTEVLAGDENISLHTKNAKINAVRSLLYLRGRNYRRVLGRLFANLGLRGFIADDSVRGPDGAWFREEEVLSILEELGDPSIYLRFIKGPALKGEDANQGESGVTLAYVATRNKAKLEHLQEEHEKMQADPRTGARFRMVEPGQL